MKTAGAIAALRKFVREPPVPVERCDGCGAALAALHEHRLEPRERRLECVCPSCAVIDQGAASPWKRVRRRAVSLDGFELTDAEWVQLGIPIRLAFFVVEGDDRRAVAFFPSPAGATQASIDADAWESLRAKSLLLGAMKPDVEALLLHHVGPVRHQLLVSIDACYRLVGTLRAGWRGFGGGPEVWREIDLMMSDLARTAREGETGWSCLV
jgi:hypothetical protein